MTYKLEDEEPFQSSVNIDTFKKNLLNELMKCGKSKQESNYLINKYPKQVSHCAIANLPDKTAITLLFNEILGFEEC